MSVIFYSLQILGDMPRASYGHFARLPREIRDQIYEDYFAVDSPTSLEKSLENNDSGVTLYVTQSDKSLMRVSRALYQEILPLWKKYCYGHNLFRIAMGSSTKHKPTCLTLSAGTLPKPPPFTRGMHITWLSYRWLHNPRFYRASGDFKRARLVFPNLRWFLKTERTELDQSLAFFEKILTGCLWYLPGRLNIFIEDATWPLLIPGENVWYKRLHKGWTRRTLMKMRDNHLITITKQLGHIINRLQKFFNIITFTFGDMANGRYRDSSGAVTRIVAALQQQVRGTTITTEYL